MNDPVDDFSHIVIDECHRSARGKWAEVLHRNPNAVQIGLTATPRQLEYAEATPEAAADEKITADNYRHFGEPSRPGLPTLTSKRSTPFSTATAASDVCSSRSF